MKPPLRCSVQARELSKPASRLSGKCTDVRIVAEENMPVDFALTVSGFCAALPAINQLSRKVIHIFHIFWGPGRLPAIVPDQVG
jgi:hypothetical protein